MTPGARLFLRQLMAERMKTETTSASGGGGEIRMEIVAECVEDPTAAVEDYLREVAQAEFGPLPRPDERAPTGARRECCTSMLAELNNQLATWRFPQHVRCPECQALYEIAPQVLMPGPAGRL